MKFVFGFSSQVLVGCVASIFLEVVYFFHNLQLIEILSAYGREESRGRYIILFEKLIYCLAQSWVFFGIFLIVISVTRVLISDTNLLYITQSLNYDSRLMLYDFDLSCWIERFRLRQNNFYIWCRMLVVLVFFRFPTVKRSLLFGECFYLFFFFGSNNLFFSKAIHFTPDFQIAE